MLSCTQNVYHLHLHLHYLLHSCKWYPKNSNGSEFSLNCIQPKYFIRCDFHKKKIGFQLTCTVKKIDISFCISLEWIQISRKFGRLVVTSPKELRKSENFFTRHERVKWAIKFQIWIDVSFKFFSLAALN